MSDNETMFQQLCEQFNQHVIRFEAHELEENERSAKLFTAQQANAEAIAEITANVASLVNDTSSIIQLTRDVQGAARIGKGVQGFLLWCLKWGVITIGVYNGLIWIIDHFNN